MSAAHHEPTDWTDEPWACLHCLRPQRAWRLDGRRRPPSCARRCRVNGRLSLKKTGCPRSVGPGGDAPQRGARLPRAALAGGCGAPMRLAAP
jgi:hypothetical protein